jgi:hypothetical protein
MIAEDVEQRVHVIPYRTPTRTHHELRGREPLELSTHEVKAFRITYDPCFLFAQTKPPCLEEFS